MTFNPSPTEQTTAITDLFLCAVALAGIMIPWRQRQRDPWKSGIWAGVLVTLVIAAALGSIAHGLLLPDTVNRHLWSMIYLTLGLSVAGVLVAALYDLRGGVMARRILPLALLSAFATLAAAKLADDSFLPFVLFEGVVMGAAFLIYGYLALAGDRPGAIPLTLGIGLTLMAALIQAMGWGAFHWIWTFDHNGTFHLVQVAGLLIILWGLNRALRFG